MVPYFFKCGLNGWLLTKQHGYTRSSYNFESTTFKSLGNKDLKHFIGKTKMVFTLYFGWSRAFEWCET